VTVEALQSSGYGDRDKGLWWTHLHDKAHVRLIDHILIEKGVGVVELVAVLCIERNG
jgi:hypothetical protein